MNDGHHPADSLGAYVLGALDDDGAREVADHLAGCAACRAEVAGFADVTAALGDTPPEALLDGPPEHGDLLLQRTLRRVRRERRVGSRARGLLTSAGIVVAVAVALGGGLVLAETEESGTAPTAEPQSSDFPEQALASMVYLHGSNDGVVLTVTVLPADGWVRVTAWVAGIPDGQKCRLVVVSRSGRAEVAGSWLTSEQAVTEGMTLDGAALVAVNQVRSVEVQDFAGHTFVSAFR